MCTGKIGVGSAYEKTGIFGPLVDSQDVVWQRQVVCGIFYLCIFAKPAKLSSEWIVGLHLEAQKYAVVERQIGGMNHDLGDVHATKPMNRLYACVELFLDGETMVHLPACVRCKQLGTIVLD